MHHDAVRDDPEAYLTRTRRRALAQGRTIDGEVHGAGLFADVSGFTPLTEALAREYGPQRGAEALTAHLDGIFHAVIERLHRHGGDVVYFSGDAVTCWFDDDPDGRHAVAAGLAMQDAIREYGTVRVGDVEVALAIKVAVCVGSAHRFVVGDPAIQLLEVLSGPIVERLAAIEHLAEKGDVLLDASAAGPLAELLVVGDARRDDESGVEALPVTALTAAVPELADPAPHAALAEELVRPWLLPTVYERLTTGRGEFVAELRAAYPVFIRFPSFDDDDPEAPAKLDRYVRNVQQVLVGYGGNLLQLTLGDKGAYLYALFGSPVSHEDDAVRAARAALDLRQVGTDLGVGAVQIGIAHGRLRSGTYGHTQRRTFVCLGDAVNLAARLMASATPGAVVVSGDVRAAAGDVFEWTDLGERSVKGKAQGVRVHRLERVRRQGARVRRYALPIVGRDVELDGIADAADRAAAGHGGAVLVESDAGRGKSRLVAEAVRRLRRRGRKVLYGEAELLSNASYGVWRGVFAGLLGVEDDLDDAAREQELGRAVTEAVRTIDPFVVDRAPLLGAVFGVHIPDTRLTASFDAKLRKTSLENLMLDLLRRRAQAEPLVIVLEDCQRIDPLSRDVLTLLARTLHDVRLLVLATQRPAGPTGLEHARSFTRAVLGDLDPADAERVIETKALEVFGRPPGPDMAALVRDRSGGNPFYIEELLQYFDQLGVDPDDREALARVQLPESVESLVLSRIDGLSEGPRRTVKVASVVGRRFMVPVLHGSYPELGEFTEVEGFLGIAREVELAVPERLEDQSWRFHHPTVRDVAYESLPFAFREQLHERVGDHLEQADPDLDELAYHYGRSANVQKKRRYLRLAGDAARAAYANAAAIAFYEQLVSVEEGSARADALLSLAQVLELTGDWPRAEAVALEARALAEEVGDATMSARADTALAEVGRKQGRFDDARALLARARTAFEAGGDQAGVGRVLHVMGTLAAQEGRYDDADAIYRESLAIRTALGDRSASASLESNLGVVAEYQGDFERSRSHHETALAIRRDLGDRWAIAVSLTNLATIATLQDRHADARPLCEEAIRLAEEVGEPSMAAISRHNLGNALRGLGRLGESGEEYGRALATYQQLDDRYYLAFLLEDVAVLVAERGDATTAHRLMGGADVVRDALGAPRAPSLESELERLLAGATASIGPEEAAAARSDGRASGEAAAVALAATACRPPSAA